jgi:hypothetical protein
MKKELALGKTSHHLVITQEVAIHPVYPVHPVKIQSP